MGLTAFNRARREAEPAETESAEQPAEADQGAAAGQPAETESAEQPARPRKAAKP